MMVRSTSRWRAGAAVLLISVLASACGGGDDPPLAAAAAPAAPVPAAPGPTTPVADTGMTPTVAAYIGALRAMMVGAADTQEPIDTAGLTPPVDNSGEPAEVGPSG